jgi:carboxylesterase
MTEQFPVLTGAETFFINGGQIGVLISHGFMGTPQSVSYIGEKLAQYGYSVFAPRLQGHGTHYDDLEKCKLYDWFESLEEGYKQLKQKCTTVFVLGQSMGGALALWLAQAHPEIAGVILVNPALTLPAYEKYREETEPRFIIEGEPDIKAKGVQEITYSKTPIRAIHQLQKLMDNTPQILPEVKCPVLGMKSIEDHVIPPENTDYIMEHIGSKAKTIIPLIHSYHVASMDHDKEKIVMDCHEFIRNQVYVDVMYG